MRVRGWSGGFVLAVGALVLPLALRAQAVTPTDITKDPTGKVCKPKSKDAACKNAKDAATPATPAPTAASENPFPTEDSQHGGDAEGGPPATPSEASGGAKTTPNGLPALPTGGDADPPEESNRARRMPKEGYTTGDEPPSSSSGGDAAPPAASSSKHDDDDDVAPTEAAPNAPVKAAKLKDLGSSGSFSEAHAKLEKTRFDDDMKVGKFYMQDGNAQGAYLRYKDAVAHVSDDPDALFGLAESAAKLNKKDEAIANYRATLEADPGGDHEKAARAALKRLGAE